MISISSISKRLIEKLRRKPYRDAYVSEHVRRGISAQIKAMREQRGLSQGKFSELLGKPQSVVSRLEDPNYGKVTVQTLLEIASTFDVALSIRFVSYSTFLSQTRDLSTNAMRVDSFSETSLTRGKLAEWANSNADFSEHSPANWGKRQICATHFLPKGYAALEAAANSIFLPLNTPIAKEQFQPRLTVSKNA